MKTLLVFISICISHAFLYSQNLEAEVTPEGIIFPSMHTFERDDLLIPVEGQCIFNLTTKSLECFSLSGTLGVGQWYTPFAMGDVSRKKK